MSQVTIVGTGAFLPGDPITNAELEKLIGPLPEEVLEGLQVERRHWAADPLSGEHRVSNSEMAEKAAREALARAGIEPAEVDLLVTSTASPEYHLPAGATFLQERLGLARCAITEVRSGCAGAVQALDIARLLLETGGYRTALVVGSEMISPLLIPYFLGRDPESVRLRDRIALYNFGDGAGAFVLRASSGAGFLGSANACIGGDREPGMHIIGGGTHAPVAAQLRRKRFVELKLDVVASERFGPKVFVTALNDLLARSGLSLGSFDACVLPEGNAPYFTKELEAAGMTADDWKTVQGKIVENLADVGATGSAAVPIALDDAVMSGRITSGDTVLLLGVETSRWIYAGTALIWSA